MNTTQNGISREELRNLQVGDKVLAVVRGEEMVMKITSNGVKFITIGETTVQKTVLWNKGRIKAYSFYGQGWAMLPASAIKQVISKRVR